MSMRDWAAREVEIACRKEAPDRKDGEWDYGCACYESALKAYNSLLEDKHSGMSLLFTKNILIRLINNLPLTPIEDTDESWQESLYQPEDCKEYQCKRMHSLFKSVYPDGTVKYYDVDRVTIHEIGTDTIWHNGFISRMIHEMYPITFPLWPAEKPYRVYVEELLTDRKNGDFDTEAVLYVVTPEGETVEINRYFKDSGDGWQEIDQEEYHNRKILHLQRLNRELREAEENEGYQGGVCGVRGSDGSGGHRGDDAETGEDRADLLQE